MLRDKFFRAGALLFIASMVTNIFNYGFQLSMGRLLSAEDFGLMNSLLSLCMIIILPFMTITTVLAKYVSDFVVIGEYGKVKGLFLRACRRIFSIGFLFFLLFLSLSFFIEAFLKMESVIPIILLGITIFTSLTFPVNTAFLQGSQRFFSLSLVNGMLGPAKFVFCSVFVLAGFGVNGVFWGLIIANAAVFVLSYGALGPVIKSSGASDFKMDDLVSYAVPVFLANLCFAILSQVDRHVLKGRIDLMKGVIL